MALTYTPSPYESEVEAKPKILPFVLPKFCPIARQTCRGDCVFHTGDDCLLRKLAEKLLGDRR